jgi:serine/threonine protein phosphatase 1
MLQWFRKPSSPQIPDGQRVYAIGDVHGCLDLLDQLLDRIAEDNASRPAAEVTLVMLGDLVDRGHHSREVVGRVRAGVLWAKTIALMGNHEAIMLEALDGNKDVLNQWLRFGGYETLISWGVSPDVLENATRDEIIAAARAVVEPSERAWLWQLRTSLRIGDYYFVHAGVRPNVALDKQSDEDRLWIREDFLLSRKPHEAMIVHGHSIHEQVEERPNRIGIDTGAYMTGRLTAVALEGAERWFISTEK